jgi:effector-binding domain-containing protein
MIDTPHITKSEALITAVIHVKVPREQIREVMGPGISELMSTVTAQGIATAGPWFSHHLKMPSDVFDFEISVPVKSPVKAAGRVRPGKLPARKVARTVYHGPYEGLGDAWGQFGEWIAANGHKPADELWEVYVAGPESGSDPSKWRTELNRPLAG